LVKDDFRISYDYFLYFLLIKKFNYHGAFTKALSEQLKPGFRPSSD